MATFDSVARDLSGLVDRGKRDAMTRCVLVVEGVARREAPVKRGTLRRSITSRVEAGGDRGIVGTNLSYARPVHEGSKPHVIRAKPGSALFWRGARHPVKVVNHPGSKGNPFLVRAADMSRADVERELAAWGGRILSKVG